MSVSLSKKTIRTQSTCSLSQALSFSSALPRWEILFFSSLGISAYVRPSYSNAESQPAHSSASASDQGVQSCLPKFVCPRDGTNLPYQRLSVFSLATPKKSSREIYLRSSLKGNRFLTWAFAVGKRCDGDC